MERRQTIREWETETGIKVRETKGFRNWGGRNRIRTNKYTKEQFRRGIKKSEIVINTEKGLEFYKGESENNQQWKSYIKANINREG